ncbi:hypothetical protein HRbin40_01069 [bacterium HR40]|nr:hypothetical protein HRbin40_01069 [bacterium HR40]
MSESGLPPPGVYSIDPHLPFLELLASALVAEPPERLADTLVLLPSRRTCGALRELLLAHAGGRTLLLPRLRPVGEPDEPELALDPDLEVAVPPAISPLRRHLLLTRLVHAFAGVPHEQAVRLAGELARLLDELQTEEVDLRALDRVVPDRFAEHWQRTLAFLAILREHWPRILAAEGRLDPAERRRRLLELQAERWRRHPPKERVVAAGITGSIPAVARLLAVVRTIGGIVVLPGLDRDLDRASWQAVGTEPTHPQHVFVRLLETMGIEREAVRPWPGPPPKGVRPARLALWRESMRPPATSELWSRNPPFSEEALADLTLIEAPDLAREAIQIALLLRRTLEVPGKRALLVTTNRHLARRVAVELARWQIEVDDSAGVPLDQTPPGSFFLLAGHLLAEGASPSILLATLGHPLARGGSDQGQFRRYVRALERAILRGPRPASDLEGIVAALRALPADRERMRYYKSPIPPLELADWLAHIASFAAPFARLRAAGERAPLSALLDAHLAFATQLAADENGDASELWTKEAGQALSTFLLELSLAADSLPDLPIAVWPAFLAVLMAGVTVRPMRPGHPRIAILGQFESRLQQADLVIVGGLVEGSWPRSVQSGPWLNRTMRQELGLPPPERHVGYAALDFLAAASAPEVALSRARRDETGAPTVPSRWLVRLLAVLRAAGTDPARLEDRELAALAAGLDRPPGPRRPCPRPKPRPPAPSRPTRLWVTDIEDLMRDPYRFYARRILALEPLDPLDAEPGPAERGLLVHRALHRFVVRYPDGLPEDGVSQLLAIGHELFAPLAASPDVYALWWPRFQRIAIWFCRRERERRVRLERVLAEVEGRMAVEAEGRRFEIRARADRIELHNPAGLVIVDYKTGTPPSRREVRAGLAPQLAVEGLIAQEGSFDGASGPVVGLEYWQLRGDEAGGCAREVCARKELEDLLNITRDGLSKLLAHFAREDIPFLAIPRPEVAARHDPYAHLARRQEWWGQESPQ